MCLKILTLNPEVAHSSDSQHPINLSVSCTVFRHYGFFRQLLSESHRLKGNSIRLFMMEMDAETPLPESDLPFRFCRNLLTIDPVYLNALLFWSNAHPPTAPSAGPEVAVPRLVGLVLSP